MELLEKNTKQLYFKYLFPADIFQHSHNLPIYIFDILYVYSATFLFYTYNYHGFNTDVINCTFDVKNGFISVL